MIGFRECTAADADKMTKWLRNNILPQGSTEEQVKVAAYKRFMELPIEPPERTRLDRLVRCAINTHDKQVFQRIMDNIPNAAIPWLDALLENKEERQAEDETLNMSDLREEPTKANVKNLIRAMDKLECLRQIRMPINILTRQPPIGRILFALVAIGCPKPLRSGHHQVACLAEY